MELHFHQSWIHMAQWPQDLLITRCQEKCISICTVFRFFLHETWNDYILIGTAHIVCGAGSRKWRSACPAWAHSSKLAAAGLTLWAWRAGSTVAVVAAFNAPCVGHKDDEPQARGSRGAMGSSQCNKTFWASFWKCLQWRPSCQWWCEVDCSRCVEHCRRSCVERDRFSSVEFQAGCDWRTWVVVMSSAAGAGRVCNSVDG